MESDGPGLRARQQRRREVIATAAVRLFSERGYVVTTLADVGEAAGVATRTVSLYFPSKIDLAFAAVDAEAERLVAAIGARDRADSVPAVIGRWMKTSDSAVRARDRALFTANPQLRGLAADRTRRAVTIGSGAIAADLACAPDAVVVSLVVGSFSGIITAVLTAELDDRAFLDAVDEAVELMDANLADASTGPVGRGLSGRRL